MKKALVPALALLTLLAMTAGLVGCKGAKQASPEAAGASAPQQGGTLTFGVYRPIPNLAYYQAYDSSNNLTAVAIWDTILRFNEKGEVVPGLASSWEVKDGNTIILHLREGVKFHDGTTMEAEDVIASLTFARNPDAKSPMAWMLDPIESMTATDSLTVTLKTKAIVDVLNALATPVGGVTSTEAIAKYGIGLGEHPIGAGPFKLEKWDRGSQIVLTRFDDYWEKGKPYLDKIVYKLIVEEFTRLSSLKSGDLDVVYNLSFANVEQLEGKKEFNTNIFGTYVVYYLALNMKKKPFDDIRVRQALNLAIDRAAICKAVTRGYSTPAITDIAPEMAGSLKGIREPYAYDVKKAKDLLAKAGYPDGFSMKLLLGSNSPDAETGVVLKEYYKKIGVNVELVSEESSTLWNHLQAGSYEDAAMSFWYPDFPDAAGTLKPFCYSTNTPPNGCCNFSYFANKKVDQLLDQAATETDMKRRAGIFQEVNTLVYEDAPRVWLYHVKEAMPAAAKVKGLKLGPMFFFQHFLQDVWVAK